MRDRFNIRLGTVTAMAVLVVLVCLFPGSRRGRAHAPVEGAWAGSELHIKILMSALSYERTLQRNDHGYLTIGVLFDPWNTDSLVPSTRILAVFQKQVSEHTFHGRQVIVQAVPLSGDDKLKPVLENLAVLYFAPGLGTGDVARVTALTRNCHVVSVTGVEDYVHGGVALGVLLRGGHPQVMVNYRAALAEGAEFSTQLLQLAAVINRKAQKQDGAP